MGQLFVDNTRAAETSFFSAIGMFARTTLSVEPKNLPASCPARSVAASSVSEVAQRERVKHDNSGVLRRRVLHLCLKIATAEPEQAKFALWLAALQGCDFRAGAANTGLRVLQVHLKIAHFEPELQKTVLRVLHARLKFWTFEPELRKCTSRTTPVLNSCHCRAGAAEVLLACFIFT